MGGRIWKWDTYDIRKYKAWDIAQVLDIGANVGGFSMMSRILFPIAKIYAIEPCIETYNRLIATAGCWGVKCFNFALGNGEKLYFRGSGVSGFNKFYRSSEISIKERYSVDSYYLSKICEMLRININKPYIIKIDCEGGERFILEDKNADIYIRNANQISLELHKNVGPREKWLEYFKSFENTHDLLISTWYRDDTRRYYKFDSIDKLPENRCDLQLMNKNWEIKSRKAWWM